MNPFNYEPVAIAAAIRALLLAGMAFGLKLTAEQIAAVMFAVEAVLAPFTRSQVTTANSLAAMAPKDLAQAQKTPEPVKDVVNKLP